MGIVTEAQVQQWLGPYKLTIDDVDDDLEASAKSITFSALSQVYDTSIWVDTASTPMLVKQVMSLFIAAWEYARTYSEDEVGANNYSASLEAKANMLLKAIASGDMDLPEVDGVVGASSGPVFFPMDNSVEEDGYTPVAPKFGMGSVF